MAVYEDFYHYDSGIYKHVSNVYEGLHCIEVVGYSEINQYWICKNSWNTGWGENGFFKIEYGDSLIDNYDKHGASGVLLPTALISTSTTTLHQTTTTTTTKKILSIPASIEVAQSSGEIFFNITSKVEWFASSNASWCKVYPEYGTGDEIIKVTFTEMKTPKYFNNNFVKNIFYNLKNMKYPDSKRKATITIVELIPGTTSSDEIFITQKN
jgi:hypothetical protein